MISSSEEHTITTENEYRIALVCTAPKQTILPLVDSPTKVLAFNRRPKVNEWIEFGLAIRVFVAAEIENILRTNWRRASRDEK